jgi:mannitol/fructose-specific phosphotransferase system IIA component (Ntr-type)
MPQATKILRHLREEHCLPVLAGETKEEVILELAGQFVASGALTEEERLAVIANVMQREDKGTTGIGGGIALPHQTRPEEVKQIVSETLIAVGLHPTGVDFTSVDGLPVHVVFLVVSPDGAEYLEVARRIAGLARDKRWTKLLRQSKTAKAVRETLEDAWGSRPA